LEKALGNVDVVVDSGQLSEDTTSTTADNVSVKWQKVLASKSICRRDLMRHDIVADAFSILRNAEKVGKKDIILPSNKIVKNVLEVLKRTAYIESYEFVDDGKSGFFKVILAGKINDCKVIKPRIAVKKGEFEKWERRYLPAKGFGILIVSTPFGIMTQEEAEGKETGGRLIGYVY